MSVEQLTWGEVAAYQSLSRAEIEVYVRSDLRSAKDLLLAEGDENTCRENMTPSEQVAWGRRLEALERPRAAERRRATHAKPGTQVGSGKLPAPIAKGETREIVGKIVGMSGSTYQRAKAMVNAGESGDENAKPEPGRLHGVLQPHHAALLPARGEHL
jgi:hypothetical protein